MAETRVINLEVQDNTKSLKAQLKEAQAEVQTLADKYGATSKEAVEAAKRAAELKDRIGDAKALTDAFNPDAKFKALSSSLSGVAGGLSAVTGAMGLMGVESQEVQKMMLKVQSAMALSQGLQALGQSRDAFKQLGAVAVNALKGIKSGIVATGIGLLVVALGTIVAYWDDIKAAVSGVNKEQEALIEKEKRGAEIAQKKLEVFTLEEKALKLAGKSEIEINKLRAQRLKTAVIEQEQYIAAMKQRKAMELEAEKRNRKIAEGVITLLFNGILGLPRLIAQMIDTIMIPVNKAITALGGTAIPKVSAMIDGVQKSMTKSLAGLFFDPEGMKAEGDKAIEEAEAKLNQLKGQVLDNELAIKLAQEGNNKQLSKDNAKTAEEKSKLQAEQRKQTIDEIEKQYEDEYKLLSESEKGKIDLIKNAKEKQKAIILSNYNSWEKAFLEERTKDEKDALNKQYEDGKISEEQYRKDLAELRKNAINLLTEQERSILTDKKTKAYDELKEIDEQKTKELNEALAKLRQDNVNRLLTEQQKEIEAINQKYKTITDLAIGNAEAEKEIAETKGREIDAINKKYAEEEEKRRKEAIARNLDIAQSGLSAIQSLTELFGKKGEKEARRAFNVKKSAQIASATIDTYKNAVAAYGSQFVPVPDPSSPVRGGIAAGIAVSAGLINIAKIASQKFEGGGANGGGGGVTGVGGIGAGGAMAPQFNVVGNNNINQLAQLQQQPIKAYVVGAEVTTQQALDRNRISTGQL